MDSIKVKVERGNSIKKEYSFNSSFTIGRSEECSIQLNDGSVSRVHIEVICDKGKWLIVDKQSRNGTFHNGIKIDRIEIKKTATIELGINGPILLLSFSESSTDVWNSSDKNSESSVPVEIPNLLSRKKNGSITENIPQKDPSVTSYIRRYFAESKDEQQAGEHTKLVREAFRVVKKKQSSKYLKIIIALGIIAVGGLVYSVYKQMRENEQKLLAENIFYEMKSLELEIASFRNQLSDIKDPKILKALEKFDEKHQQLQKNYDKLVDELGIYNLNEEDKLVVKTARIFGECEFAIPPEFINEVNNYIKRWQSSPRLINALERANQRGFTQIIVNYLARNQLPSQFFYLALQESDFRETIVGPQTRYGYAKGIWQFISPTAQKYGLAIGPLADQNVYDPGDDRFNFPKATSAAARYIKDIYTTDAQASGLLVMASYNWGEHNIINLIRSMPENPRERNFWKLLEKYKEKIPDETYNYVFYIFSAAVICENPRLFGFNFENPLKDRI